MPPEIMFWPNSRMGVKKPTKVKPVHSAKVIHNNCLADLRRILLRFQGPLSSFMRFMRSPSVSFSIHRKTSVQTVWGQANPHHRRPARAVKKNSESPAVISNRAR